MDFSSSHENNLTTARRRLLGRGHLGRYRADAITRESAAALRLMPDEKTYPHALQPGHELLWYRIREVLGQGSFGITYLCQDLNHHRLVVIKEYAPEYFARREDGRRMVPGSDTDASDFVRGLERFVHAAETLYRFQHPNIVRVMDVFETNNTAYMIMDYERGESLGSVLERQKTLSDLELCGLLFPVLDGLEAIHRAGMVHGDLRPSTIHIRMDGSPVLLDFGCARQAIGTLASPGYAPIEQYTQGKSGPWTDFYGLGATGYRAVVGSAPIDAVARAEAIQAEAPDPYEPLSGRTKATYSQALLKGIDHALAFESTRRPQTVSEWREDLKLHATHTWAIKVKDSSRASVNLEDVPTLPSTLRWGSVGNLGHDRGGDAVSSPHSSGATEQIPSATVGHVSRWLDRGRNVALGIAFAGVGLMFVLVAGNSDPATRTGRDIAYTLPTQQPAVASSKQTTRKPRHTRPGEPSSAVQVPKPQLLAGGQPAANASPIPVATDTPSSAVDAKESVADIRDRSEGEPPRVRGLPSALSSPVQGQADPPASVDSPGAGQPQSQVSQDGRLPQVSDPKATDDASASSETNVRTLDTSMMTKPPVVATDDTKPSDQRTAQIAQLLAQADQDVAALRLTVPASGNAFAKYREVLVLDPENSRALNGIASIVYTFVQLIDRAIETRRFGLADLYLRRVVTILPENRNLHRARETGEPPRVRGLPSALSSPVQGQADPPASVDPPGAGQPQSQVSQDGRLPQVSDPKATDDASASSETNVRTLDTSMMTKPPVVATDDTKPSDQRTAQIAQLLAQADQDVAALRLTVPASGNAFAKYREVLVLDPENSRALNGIASIVYKYVQLLDRAIETRRFGLADLYLSRAVMVLPEESEPPPSPENHRR